MGCALMRQELGNMLEHHDNVFLKDPLVDPKKRHTRAGQDWGE